MEKDFSSLYRILAKSPENRKEEEKKSVRHWMKMSYQIKKDLDHIFNTEKSWLKFQLN